MLFKKEGPAGSEKAESENADCDFIIEGKDMVLKFLNIMI